jgi:acetyl-CoA C-acetyltransferase
MLAAQGIATGDIDVAVAGGMESMSNCPYLLPRVREGLRMGDGTIVDSMIHDGLWDSFHNIHMGLTGEHVSETYRVTREEQDRYAVESHRKAAEATANGWFTDEILPVSIPQKKGDPIVIDRDESIRTDTTVESLGRLKPAFKKDGTVTAGNASGINDAGAAVVLMDSQTAKRQNFKPLARLVAYAHAGVEPQVMGLGPIPAVRRVFEKAGLKPADMDVIESNEAFAVQAMAVTKDLGLDPAKVNPNGGAVALGHPIGATGAILTVKALYELERIGKRYALVTMCIGGGQGIAAIFERT